MTVRGVVVSRRTSRTRRPELSISAGPRVLAQPGAGQFADLYGAAWAVALFKDGPQLLQLQGETWTEQSDAGALAALVGVSHVSLAFDQAARPVLAFEDRGQVYVRQWDAQTAQYLTRGPWPGRCPLLLADALVGVPLGESDVLLLHLQEDAQTVVSRVQRDLYATAYTLGALPSPGVLDQVVSVGSHFELLGEADQSAVALLSGLYPVSLRQSARADLSAPAGGDLFAVVIAANETEAARADLSAPAGGDLFAVVLTETGTETARADLSAPAGGDLFAVVLNRAGLEAARADLSAPAGGALHLAVVSVSPSVEPLLAALTVFTGGKYEVA